MMCIFHSKVCKKIKHVSEENLTLFVEHVPLKKNDILRKIRQLAPNVSISSTSITYAFDVRELFKSNDRLEYAKKALNYCMENPSTQLYDMFWRDSGEPAKNYYELSKYY